MLAPTAAPNTTVRNALGSLFAPIAQDLERAEQIFETELASDVPFIRDLVGHLAHYRGKQLRMIIPSGAGGGYDTYARVLAHILVGEPVTTSPGYARHQMRGYCSHSGRQGQS